MDDIEHADEIRIAIEALRQADRDMVAFELDEADGENTFIVEGSTYERIKLRVDAAIAAIEDEGLSCDASPHGRRRSQVLSTTRGNSARPRRRFLKERLQVAATRLVARLTRGGMTG